MQKSWRGGRNSSGELTYEGCTIPSFNHSVLTSFNSTQRGNKIFKKVVLESFIEYFLICYNIGELHSVLPCFTLSNWSHVMFTELFITSLQNKYFVSIHYCCSNVLVTSLKTELLSPTTVPQSKENTSINTVMLANHAALPKAFSLLPCPPHEKHANRCISMLSCSIFHPRIGTNFRLLTTLMVMNLFIYRETETTHII